MKYLLTFVLFFSIALPAYASEVTGTLTTGVSTGNGVNGMVIVEPTANPVAGPYTSTQNVVLTGGEGTLSIHYTIDGSTPTCTSGTTYSSAITVATSMTIKALSCYPSSVASPVAEFVYAISAAASGGGGGGTPPDDADFNNDGKVDIIDLNILSVNWGSTTGTHATGDANGDSNVDIFDLNILAAQWTG